MPNSIKYNLGAEQQALKKGNFYIGTGDVGKGPTSTTGYYNGITPPVNGYTIYLNKVSGGPSIYTCTSNSQLISLTSQIAGQTFTTLNQCLVYFAGQTDKICVNRDYESIVTDGLILNLDAGFIPSYPHTGTTIHNIGIGSNNGTLVNGPLFNSQNGGTLVFDGVNDVVTGTSTAIANTPFTISVWIRPRSFGGSTFFGVGIHPAIRSSIHLRLTSQTSFLFGMYGDDLHVGIDDVNNNWSLLTCTLTPGFLQTIYQNGVVKGTRTSGGYFVGSLDFTVGAWSLYGGNEYIAADIATAQVYNRALSQAEVLQNFNQQKARFGL